MIIRGDIGIIVVGYGYWGPNIVRNLVERPEFRVLGVCERDPKRAAEVRRCYPGLEVFAELETALLDPRVDAAAIATPPASHFACASQALAAGKHVLVEKPLATTGADAVALIEAANQAGLVLMPGHTFVYSPPVNKVRDLIRDGVIGDVHFITSSRMNLGKYQTDGVVCDLAPHDMSILLYWLGRPVAQIAATALDVLQDGVAETAFLTITFAGQTTANVQISWLAPRKIRQMVVVGSKRMVQYEDTAGDDAVRLYDRGMEFTAPPASFGEYRLTYRTGDMVAPRLEPLEPLSLEFEDFARAIRTGEPPRSDADLGLQIVHAIEAAEASLRRGGAPLPVPLGTDLDFGSDGNGHESGTDGNGHAPNGHSSAARRRITGAL